MSANSWSALLTTGQAAPQGFAASLGSGTNIGSVQVNNDTTLTVVATNQAGSFLFQVNPGDRGAFLLQDSTITVNFAFAGTITANGQLYLAWTDAQVVSQTPTNITVDGNVNATVSGNVNIANVPTVNANVSGNVNIANTPSVNVAGTPNVAISGTPNVNVTGGSISATVASGSIQVTSGVIAVGTKTPAAAGASLALVNGNANDTVAIIAPSYTLNTGQGLYVAGIAIKGLKRQNPFCQLIATGTAPGGQLPFQGDFDHTTATPLQFSQASANGQTTGLTLKILEAYVAPINLAILINWYIQ